MLIDNQISASSKHISKAFAFDFEHNKTMLTDEEDFTDTCKNYVLV